MDKIIRCITSDGCVMASAIDASDLVFTAQKIHHTSPVATAALGRLLAASSLMGAQLKQKAASITLRIKGGGPLGSVIAVADSAGNCRGYVENGSVELPLNARGKLDVAGAVGKDGILNVMRDYGAGEPYVGQIPIVSGEIAEDITEYYARSEQIPTVCALGVLVDKEERQVLLAGGLLIQLLPAAGEEAIQKLERAVQRLEPMTTLLAKGFSVEQIVRSVLSEFEVEVLDENPVAYACNCSRQKVENAVCMLSPEEIRTLAGEEGFAEVKCHFCDKTYRLSQNELEGLAKRRQENAENACKN